MNASPPLAGTACTVAARSPKAPSARLLALVFLGYGYLGGVLLLIAGAVGGAAWAAFSVGRNGILLHLLVKFGLPLLGLGMMILRAAWVRIPPPEGIRLSESDSPELFRAVEEISAKIDAPRIHRVLLTDKLNASVAQIPRLGVFGWPVNYLTVGLPLLETLSVEEFRAVLAHELGHLARSHGKAGAWIYRLRMSWERLRERVETEHRWGAGILRRFVAWYVPRLATESLAISREHELAADLCSVEVSRRSAAANALLRFEVAGTFLAEEFWPEIFRAAARSSEPPEGVFRSLAEAVRSRISIDFSRCVIDRAARRPTDPDDTHPSLADRLAAIGEPAILSTARAGRAAETLFGDRLDRVRSDVEQRWRLRIHPSWSERHREATESRARADEFEKTSRERALTQDERFAWANACEDAGEVEASRSLPEDLARADRPRLKD